MRAAFLMLMAAIAFPLTGQAQDGSSPTTLSATAFQSPDPFALDEDYAAAHGIPILAPVDLLLPNHPNLAVRTVSDPDRAEVLIVEFSRIGDGGELTFLENMQITDGFVPMHEDADDPVATRALAAAEVLEMQFYPIWADLFPDTEVLEFNRVDLGNAAAAVHLLLAYRDPRHDANMLTRAVLLAHPTQAESYLVTINIDRDRVRVTDPVTLAATITGQILNTWSYR
ncbi:hypothetical protein [Gymnodinialimonas sp. 57CJ19]|uniref:hypothetical protein n=1 Tax=Gymnodinialimonas sp. 57CJ19 TaxID=3138498 RepID=UPI00313437C2